MVFLKVVSQSDGPGAPNLAYDFQQNANSSTFFDEGKLSNPSIGS